MAGFVRYALAMGRGAKQEPTSDFDAVKEAGELDEILGDQPEEQSSDEYIRTLEAEIEGLNNLLNQTAERYKRAEAKRLELLEETERIKARLKNEADQRVARKVADVLVELVEVDDDLDRAIEAAQKMDHNPAVVDGVVLVQKSFDKKLEKLGVEVMHCLGNKFDPNLHEAVSMMSTDDPAQDGVILAVVRTGYTLKGEVLRAPRVAVGKLAS